MHIAKGYGIIFLLIISSSAFFMITQPVDPSESTPFEHNDVQNVDIQNTNQDNSIEQLETNNLETNATHFVESQPVEDAIETSQILNEVHSPGRDSYIVDFGFQQTFTFSYSKVLINHNGIFTHAYLRLDTNVQFGIRFTLPVNITLTYSDTVSAGNRAGVTATMYDAGIPAGFFLDYGFAIGGEYDATFIGSETFSAYNYSNSYPIQELAVPIDPTALAIWKVPLPINLIPGVGTVLSKFFGLDLVITPQIDASVSADVFYDNLEGTIDRPTVSFDTYKPQTFNLNTDEFATDQTDVAFGLQNFDMQFDLGITWGIGYDFKGILNFLGGNHINLFTYPTFPVFGLATTDITAGFHDITASNKLPYFDISSYTSDDTNGVLEPGDTVTLDVDFKNYGYGGAKSVTVFSGSDNVSIVETPSTYTEIHPLDTISHSLTITLNNNYTWRNVTILFALDWTSPNGTMMYNIASLRLQVLQAGDAFINIDKYSILESNDGLWDPNEQITLDIDMSKVGSGTVTAIGIEIFQTQYGGYTSLNSYDEVLGPSISVFNSTSLTLTSPSSFTYERMEVAVYIYMQLSSGEVYADGWILELELNPPTPDIELVNVYENLVSGTDDNLYQAGEVFSLYAELVNIGTASSGPVLAGLYSNSSDLTFENELFYFNSIDPSNQDTSINTLDMTISLFAINQTVQVTLLVVYETPSGDLEYKSYTFLLSVIALPPPEIQLNYWESFVYLNNQFTSDIPQPGTYALIYVNLDNIGSLGLGGIAKLQSDHPDVELINDTSYYGTLQSGANSDGDGFVLYIPANFEGGQVIFEVNMTIYSASGEPYEEIGYFMIDIAAGDVQAPDINGQYPLEVDAGTTFDVTLDVTDNVGIDEVYVAIFNPEIDDYEYYLIDEINGGYDFSVETPAGWSNVTMYVLAFDVSGNYQISTKLEVIIDDPTEESTPTSEINDTDQTGSSETPVSSSNPSTVPSRPSSDGSTNPSEAPIPILWILITLSSIGIMSRRKNIKRN